MNKRKNIQPPDPVTALGALVRPFVLLGLYPLPVKNVTLDVGFSLGINGEDIERLRLFINYCF